MEILYSIEDEMRTARSTIDTIQWFEKNNYSLDSVRFPIINLNANNDEIKKVVEKEFDSKAFEKVKLELQTSEDVLKQLIDKLNKVFSENKITPRILLTNYGTGGAYDYQDNLIMVNIHNVNSYATTLFHETIHLFIEPYIQEHSLSQWEKERIVDLMLNHKELSFLGCEYWQENHLDTTVIDKNIDTIFRNPREFFEIIVSEKNSFA